MYFLHFLLFLNLIYISFNYYFFTGINLIRSKKIYNNNRNLFYLILYIIFGCLFYSTFHPDSFWLSINGNGGFIGKFLKDSFLFSLINLNQNISYFVIIILTLIIFLFSINFRVKFIFHLFKKIFLSLNKKKNNQKVYEELKPSISPTESFIQEDLPFTNIKSDKKNIIFKFKLPSPDFFKKTNKSRTRKKKYCN